MPRSFGLLPTSIWDDETFMSLTPDAQWLYMVLLSQPELNPGGILMARPMRWSGLARAASPERVRRSLAELEVAGWAYTDDVAQDTFVSGFFEAEHIARQPRRLIGAMTAIEAVHSDKLRAIASAELSALVSSAPAPQPPRGMRKAVLERDGYRCRECGWKPGDPVPERKGTGRPVFRTLEIDHIWPKSLGGPDEESNYQVLCTTCNCRKGARVLWLAVSAASCLPSGMTRISASSPPPRA